MLMDRLAERVEVCKGFRSCFDMLNTNENLPNAQRYKYYLAAALPRYSRMVSMRLRLAPKS